MNRKWELTPFGLTVRQKLLEKNLLVKDLAGEIGANEKFLIAMLYGKKKGVKYLEPIKNILDITTEGAAANE